MKAFEPGSGNTYTYHRDPDPIDNQAEVKVYRLNPDGSKGEFLRTMPAYPEGWEERRFVPGSGGKKKEKEEDDEMAKKRTKAKIDWKEIGPKIDELNAKGVTTRAIADTVGISYASVFRYLEKQKEITPSKKQIKKDIFTGETEDSWKCSACGGTTDYVERFTDAEGEKLCMQCYLGKEQQTQPPEPEQAANQEPERETTKSAENSIPYSVERLENIGREINPDDDTKIYTPERQNYTITQYNEQVKQGGFTAADEEPIPYILAPDHHNVAEEVACLLDRKGQDYGTENIKKFGSYGVLVRVSDKVERLINLSKREDKPSFEGIEDSWRDIAGYAILALIELREGR